MSRVGGEEPRAEKQIEFFAGAMLNEMQVNHIKGHWLDGGDGPITDEVLVYELLYHAFKLVGAVRQNAPIAAILEYAADTGNQAWFVADRHGALIDGAIDDRHAEELLDYDPQQYEDWRKLAKQITDDLFGKKSSLGLELPDDASF